MAVQLQEDAAGLGPTAPEANTAPVVPADRTRRLSATELSCDNSKKKPPAERTRHERSNHAKDTSHDKRIHHDSCVYLAGR